jgi:ABC-type glycerol-3-phosphate transport system substrate-binding protein
LLYQNGGRYYNDLGTASELDSDIAVNVFKMFCNYYTDYKLDRATSVEERFRTGESPIIIADYTTYNNFAVSAPDIAGLWSFTQIPGTVQEDGSIDRSVACTGLATMIMSDTKYPEESWEFLKWWTSADTQSQYGQRLESVLGLSARWGTANLEAYRSLPWSVSELEVIETSWKGVVETPYVPGSYFTTRHMTNAISRCMTGGYKPRASLEEAIEAINIELERKREDLGLDD